jgi:hypothetical protein
MYWAFHFSKGSLAQTLLFLCSFLLMPKWVGGWIWTLDLRFSSRAVYHCASATEQAQALLSSETDQRSSLFPHHSASGKESFITSKLEAIGEMKRFQDKGENSTNIVLLQSNP